MQRSKRPQSERPRFSSQRRKVHVAFVKAEPIHGDGEIGNRFGGPSKIVSPRNVARRWSAGVLVLVVVAVIRAAAASAATAATAAAAAAAAAATATAAAAAAATATAAATAAAASCEVLFVR